MKTSNKILLFIGLALLISPFINAYSLRQKYIKKDYTLLKNLNAGEFEPIALVPTDSIHIIGDHNLSVKIIQSDSVSVEKEKNSDVYIYEENGILTIKYSKKNSPDFENPGLVKIKTPSIKAISFKGKLIVDSTGNKYRSTVTRHYSPFEVTIQGFKTDQMNIHGIGGGGDIVLNNNQLKKLSLDIGEYSRFQIDKKSYIDSMNVHAIKNSTISFNGTHVNSLKTKLDSTVSLILKGNNITNIIPYE